ncbi:MAG: hypothetical protein LBS50_08705 [Prevotellaceae bacterium]|jgi:hypothetical protein|nr:hypothetical protein [Prevotellaceae bacterium]
MTVWEEIPNLIRLNKFETFNVSTSSAGGKDFVFVYDDTKDVEENIQDLDMVMSALTGRAFYLFGKKKENANRQIFCFKFSKDGINDAKVAGVHGANIGYTDDFVQKMIAVEIGKVKSEMQEEILRRREQELKEKFDKQEREIKEERKELDKRKGDGIEMFLQSLGKAYPQVKRFISGDKSDKVAGTAELYAKVAGTEEIQEKAVEVEILEDNELETRINDLLQRWNAAEPDWLMIMEKIVQICEDKREIDVMGGMVKLPYEKLKSIILEY